MTKNESPGGPDRTAGDGRSGAPDWSLLERYLAGDARPDESAVVEQWATADAKHAALLAAMTDTVRAYRREPPRYDAAAAWQRAASTVRSRPSHPAGGHISSLHRPTPTGTSPHLRPRGVGGGNTWRVAVAAAGVALGVGLVVRSVSHRADLASSGRTYATATGQRLSVTLVDGTRLTLAPASRVQVVGDREVALEGEAYFAVVHDAAHPFAVRVRGAVARDVGTRFDVRAYPQDAAARVIVAEGEVAVGSAHLRSGDLATIGDHRVVIAHEVDVGALTNWTSGELVFHDTPLSEAAQDLARWYGVDVRVSDPLLRGRRLTASVVPDGPIDGVLDMLAPAVRARYERHGQVVVLMPVPPAR